MLQQFESSKKTFRYVQVKTDDRNQFPLLSLIQQQFSNIHIEIIKGLIRPENLNNLAKQSSIKTLTLANIPINLYNIDVLENTLKSQPLESLTISNNPMAPVCKNRLFGAIAQNTTIKILALTGMNLTDVEAEDLLKFVKASSNLERLDLTGNTALSFDVKKNLAQECAKNGVRLTLHKGQNMYTNLQFKQNCDQNIALTQVNCIWLEINKAIKQFTSDSKTMTEGEVNELRDKTNQKFKQLANHLKELNSLDRDYKVLLQRYHLTLGLQYLKLNQKVQAGKYFAKASERKDNISFQLQAKKLKKVSESPGSQTSTREQKVIKNALRFACKA